MNHTYSNFESQTDSDTSTASSIKSLDDANNSLLKSCLIQPVLPRAFINPCTNNEINDAFELSLLRFIHLIFSTDGIINFTNLTSIMDLNNLQSRELYDFFIDNPGVMNDYSFYYSDAGIHLRIKWCNFLMSRPFEYKNNQLHPCINNFFNFFEHFTTIKFNNIDLNLSPEQNKLNIIYSHLNWNWKSLSVTSGVYKTPNTNSFIQNIVINGINMFVWEIMSVRENNNEIFASSEFRYY
jgi:hypothetical protein